MNKRTTDHIATVVFWAMGILAMGILLYILGEIFVAGLGTALNPKFFLGTPQAMQEGGGIFPMIVSSIYLSLWTMLIALPVSLGAAIYLAEFARKGSRTTGVIRFCADSLASLPSIVFGLFGMVLFAMYLGWGTCLMAGACTLALLNLPVLIRSAEEAMLSVPHTYREASLSLGAGHWYTIRQVVLPSAMPGILAGTVLTVGRILGESASLIYVMLLFMRKVPSLNPFSNAAPLASNIWYTQSEALIPDYRRVVNGSAAFLLLMVLIINFSARALGKYYQKKKGIGEFGARA
jgi:phosphate transport system permease protein